MTTVERYVPSVEDALDEYQYHCWYSWVLGPGPMRERCALNVEACSVALDMALALASEERIRASVAW